MSSLETVRQYYDDSVLKEWDRLERHSIEFKITSHYLKRYIKPGQRVLDVGGGPGRYSLMLAELGCDVTLVDLSPANVAFALQKAKELNLPLAAYAGDACRIDEIVSGKFDCVLNMGPLYHLQTDEARTQSIQACRAILVEGGLMFASIITLHAGMLYYLENDPALISAPNEQEYLRHLEQDRSFTGLAFTESHFMRVWDLCPFMERNGFETLHRVSCEGLCATREKDISQLPPDLISRWVELSLKLCEQDEFLGFAQHVLYIGSKC